MTVITRECKHCYGRGFIGYAVDKRIRPRTKKYVCTKCGGDGIRKYVDEEKKSLLISLKRFLKRLFSIIINFIKKITIIRKRKI